MAYSKEGIMAQIYVAFGQGTGAIRVSQAAALELHRWYHNAITDQVISDWGKIALQVLDRIRAIGALAALKAVQEGSVKITARFVYEAAVQVQIESDTPQCPEVPSPPPG